MIEAIATTKKITPTIQRKMQKITPSKLTLSELVPIRWAKPNNKVNQLTNSETMRITIFKKYDSRITGNFMIACFNYQDSCD